MSPLVFEFESLKFRVNANDHHPPHVHIEGKGTEVRINLLTLEIMDDSQFTRSDLIEIIDQVQSRWEELMEEWRTHHD